MVMRANKVFRKQRVAQKSCIIKASLFFAGKKIQQSLRTEDNTELIWMCGRPELS
jgi:hypothetical protein